MPWPRQRLVTGILIAVIAAMVANCSSDLRRDDLDGRPCPCLDGWARQDTPNGCICVRASSHAGASNAGAGNAAGAGLGGTSTLAGLAGAVNNAGSTVTILSVEGGSAATGGSTDPGGAIATGGTIDSGGSIATGGTIDSGGSTCSCGSTGPGGSIATGGAIATGGTIASAGARSCPDPLPPPASVSPCPLPCTDCSGGVCTIDCSSKDDCATIPKTCPSGMPCALSCAGLKSCNGFKLTCPAGYRCDVNCSGIQSCSGLTVDCQDSAVCSLTCGGSNRACDSGPALDRPTTLNCGRNECQAACQGSERPVVNGCENSCHAAGCGCN